ncbi:MAG: tetratricopeptide repeat protein [Arcicella sp.]|nr:tetratricopeptide repeat protein [Arcicella sp.]
MINRLEILRQFVAEEPQDPFNHYALATELLKTNKNEAKEFFEYLIQHHSEYLPTYYHLGALYVELGEQSAAELTYLKGIELAKKLKNEKTLKELKGAYQMFLDELED